ncbi:SCO family protein [Massilia niastensis]|uniref:SCO family protein n=1 Tax=Massilia niastensis TaxID=544911 RepID=UPI00039BAE6B|nr:SCO family protein [Massilia niastensis]
MDRRLLLATMGGVACGATANRLHAATQGALAAHPYLPDPVLQDQTGKRVRFYSDLLAGKVVVINMMYAVCTRICPANTARLREVQEALGDRVGRDVHFYSLTLRPELDSPAALADYARRYDIGPGWSFLTGRPRDIDLVRRKLGFYDTDPVADADLANHTGALRIGNVARDRWMMMPNRAQTAQIVKAIDNIG